MSLTSYISFHLAFFALWSLLSENVVMLIGLNHCSSYQNKTRKEDKTRQEF